MCALVHVFLRKRGYEASRAIHGTKHGYRVGRWHLKKVCVISGRSVYSRRTGVQLKGKGLDINLTNDQEEGFKCHEECLRRRVGWGGGVQFNF